MTSSKLSFSCLSRIVETSWPSDHVGVLGTKFYMNTPGVHDDGSIFKNKYIRESWRGFYLSVESN